MKILAIHVGKIKNHQFANGNKRTAIVKSPIAGPIRATKLGLEGDQVGNPKYHGGEDKAIYAYSHDHYAWWKSQYPDLDFPISVFGENLVLQGLNEHELWVGDRFSAGEVVIEITTPRMPCQTLAMRMGDPQFVSKFLEADRPGAYIKVIEEGDLEVGMEFTPIERGETGLTVVEAYQLYGNRTKDASLFEKALQEPRLIASWKERIGNHAAAL